MTDYITPRDVLDRLKQVAGVSKDVDLAERIGVKPNVVANWRARGHVPPGAVLSAATKLGVRVEVITGRLPDDSCVRDGPAWDAPTIAPPEQSQSAEDPRLDAVLAWWAHYWETHDADERTWALVQLRRAIPEAGEWIRRYLRERAGER